MTLAGLEMGVGVGVGVGIGVDVGLGVAAEVGVEFNVRLFKVGVKLDSLKIDFSTSTGAFFLATHSDASTFTLDLL